MLKRLSILWILVRRDYALQFAGSSLGISWMLVQNLSLILVYTIVFFFLNVRGNSVSDSDFIAYTFSGLLFWIPLQEYMIRGTSILTENRQLIKRSPLGPEIFLWVPFVQMLIHFSVTAVPVAIVLGVLGKLNLFSCLFAFPLMFATGYLLSFPQGYLARANVILRDITPLIRLISQFFFWSLPILYLSTGFLSQINQWNPLNFPLEVFRYVLLNDAATAFHWTEFLPYLILFPAIGLLSRSKFHSVILDHL
ncbi:ABC transporter permease [Leptospira ellisii]|uniref:ABC transporter permease n=1 Tax=Leptospira ellisii TaxID=2023197 RepID=A0A2N0BIW2_9LEPT|nr:ABC transporter permease [Leptospira ellisii]MDV6235636.1 ABC transporter permease [Leptospira ellisii]PJZ92761.1 ABC transporter permease [Leptospira ellisii]PKA03890.1 ABC transporter permease [Leptospira ellisii]